MYVVSAAASPLMVAPRGGPRRDDVHPEGGDAESGDAGGVLPVKKASLAILTFCTRRPGYRASLFEPSTPESMTVTPTPLPSYPRPDLTQSAPMILTLSCSR